MIESKKTGDVAKISQGVSGAMDLLRRASIGEER